MIRAVELWSGPLTQLQMETEVGSIIAVFQSEGWDRLVVTCGGGTAAWQAKSEARNPLPLGQLRPFVAESLKTSLFRRGRRSVTLECVDGSFRFDLTSDRQIGLTTGNLRLASDVETDWKTKRYRCFEVDHHTWYQLTPTGRFWME